MDFDAMLDTVRRAFADDATGHERKQGANVLRIALQTLEPQASQPAAQATPQAAPQQQAAPDFFGMFVDRVMAELPDEEQQRIRATVADDHDVPMIPWPR